MLNQSVIQELIRISREAGAKIMEYYSNQLEHSVSIKDDQSPFTQADLESNAIIENGLQQIFRGVPIISEENEFAPYSERQQYDLCWMVDPLDGTKEFINRTDEFTVNIALIKKQRVIAGFVHVPVTGETFWAVKNQGAFRQKADMTIPLTCSSFQLSQKNLKVVTSRSHLDPQTTQYIASFNEPEIITVGSSIKFMMIASGEADIYPRLSNIKEWDMAASQIIIEESGGSMLNINSGEPLFYNKEKFEQPYFIAQGKII